MSLTLDLHVPGHSWLHRLDPRVKLWMTLLGIVTTFVVASPLGQALLLLALLAVLRGAGIPWPKLAWLWRQMRLLVLLILLLQPFFTPSGEIWVALGPVHITTEGVNRALLLALRALVMAYVTGGLLFTTDQPTLVRGFVRLGLPYTWGLTLSLTLRFLPAINSLFVAVREAQAARGWVARGNLVHRARDYLPVLVAVAIGTLRLSDQLTLALAARGMSSDRPRTSWRRLRMRPADWRALVVVTLLFAALLVRRLLAL